MVEFTTFEETLQYLYANLPIFQRVGAAAYRKDLTNTIRLCEAIGNPQNSLQTVHVGGTNGKGSTSHMLASVLQSSGYKTGLYTSPHLKNFTERIKVNGAEITPEYVIQFVNRIRPHIETLHPSFFEITVAMAFDYFASVHVDIAVIEVGLGGRLDSTNIITPVVSLITNIGNDHKDLLGDTPEKIATEKAGIIKHSVPVVVSEWQENVKEVFQLKAAKENAPLYIASNEYHSNWMEGKLWVRKNNDVYISDLLLPLKGQYQTKNVAGVLKVCDLLVDRNFNISKESIIEGLEKTVEQTGLKGRWQKLGEFPLVVCDTGHNEDGIKEVMTQVALQSFTHLHIVWGMVKDKDIDTILRLLPAQAHYYFCQAQIPRSMDAHELQTRAARWGLKGKVIPSVNEAIRIAKSYALESDFIFIGGSTFVVAEIENL